MLHTILPTQMQAAEQTAFAAGLSPLLTMETAARAAFDVLLDLLGCDCRGKNVLFLCGPGNNGGDGLVMARLLLQARGFARIILLDTPKTAEAQINLRHLQAMGADIEAVPDELLEDEYDAVVDALFGTGFTGSIAADSPAGRLLTWANTCGPMLSIDVPSGMDAATGAVEGVCARAIWTVTFHRPKPGLYLTERRDCVGEITVAPIGLPREFDPQGGLLVNEEGDLHTLLPARPASAHKGDCGRTVIYAGSLGMAGAAMMAARAALHAGAGLTTVICPRAAMPVLQQEVPNATCLAAEDQPTPKCDALLMGCGIAENDDTYADMMRLKATDAYQVWDAGALNLLAGHPQQRLADGFAQVIVPQQGTDLLPQIEQANLPPHRLHGTACPLGQLLGGQAVLTDEAAVLLRLVQIMEPPLRQPVHESGEPFFQRNPGADDCRHIAAAFLPKPLQLLLSRHQRVPSVRLSLHLNGPGLGAAFRPVRFLNVAERYPADLFGCRLHPVRPFLTKK